MKTDEQSEVRMMSPTPPPGSVPADDIQHHDEIIILEIRHVRSQDVGLHFQLDVLRGEGRL